MTRSARLLLICGGTALVGIGLVGVFVPLLPTTPFLLLAAFLYARSSKPLYNGLMRNRLIGNYLRRYYEKRSMSWRHKVLTVSFLWIVLAMTAGLAVDAWWVRGVLGGVGIAVTTHLLLLSSEQSGPQGDS